MMKRVIVTGGAGFIGSNLVDALIEKYQNIEILVLDNFSTGKREYLIDAESKSELIEVIDCDISDFDSLYYEFNLFGEADCVFHLAALADVLPSLENPDDYYRANVTGTHNVLECMREFGVKNIVYSASSSCYGDDQEDGGTQERQIVVGDMLAPYALYKWIGELEIEFYCKKYGFNAISTRYFNVTGRRVKCSNEFGIPTGVFLAQHFNGHPITFRESGKTCSRDFIDVRDVVRIAMWFGERLANKKIFGYDVVNVGTGIATVIYDIVDYINGHKDVVTIPDRKNEAKTTRANIAKLRRLMGVDYLEPISVKDGIRYLIENDSEYFKNISFPTYGVSKQKKLASS